MSCGSKIIISVGEWCLVDGSNGRVRYDMRRNAGYARRVRDHGVMHGGCQRHGCVSDSSANGVSKLENRSVDVVAGCEIGRGKGIEFVVLIHLGSRSTKLRCDGLGVGAIQRNREVRAIEGSSQLAA